MAKLFEITGLFVLPLWLVMILAPRAQRTARLLGSPLVVFAPVAVYALLVLPDLPTLLPVVAQPKLDEVMRLFQNPAFATAGWAHYLAFDLWVGRFIVLDARERDLPGPLLSLILLLTLLLGPLGLAAYGIACTKPWQHVRRWFATSLDGSRALSWVGLASLATGTITAGLMAIDDRQLGGTSVWLKPTKFGISIAIASFTLALLLPALRMPAKTRARAITTIAVGLAIEQIIITFQAARGVPSHFNASNLFDGALFQIMGAAITLVTIAAAFLAWYALRTPYENRALGSGIRSGLWIMIAGSLVAFLMTRPTTAQLATLTAGEATPLIGAHSVGVADGAAGMPLTRWNLQGGDLRVPHFIGLHALQLMPLAGLWLSRRREWSGRLALQFTRIAAFAYGGLFLTSLVQAMRGQSLAAPDAITVIMAGSVLIGAALTALAAWWADRTPSRQPATLATNNC